VAVGVDSREVEVTEEPVEAEAEGATADGFVSCAGDGNGINGFVIGSVETKTSESMKEEIMQNSMCELWT
jgi:hypothetical protein